MEKDRKFFFDINIFDAPEKEEVIEDLPPPPPVFSEEELAVAKDMAFEQGRQQGQQEQKDSREQYIAKTLDTIAQNFSKLFAAETLRENIFEKESLRLTMAALDILFPSLNEKLGRDEVLAVIHKTLSHHKKTKEITIHVADGTKAEIEDLIKKIRKDEHDDVLWRVLEKPDMEQGDCVLEWGDGGAVRDSKRAAKAIHESLLLMLGEKTPISPELGHSDEAQNIVLSKDLSESPSPSEDAPATMTGDKP